MRSNINYRYDIVHIWRKKIFLWCIFVARGRENTQPRAAARGADIANIAAQHPMRDMRSSGKSARSCAHRRFSSWFDMIAIYKSKTTQVFFYICILDTTSTIAVMHLCYRASTKMYHTTHKTDWQDTKVFAFIIFVCSHTIVTQVNSFFFSVDRFAQKIFFCYQCCSQFSCTVLHLWLTLRCDYHYVGDIKIQFLRLSGEAEDKKLQKTTLLKVCFVYIL